MHEGDKNAKCLHEKTFIVRNEGRGRRRFRLSTEISTISACLYYKAVNEPPNLNI